MNRVASDISARAALAMTIEIGSIADYHALARFHYRAAAPATHVRVLRLRHERDLIGVLTVSMPTLDGAWRQLAWPCRYAARGGDRTAVARRLNREVRTISRVVIDPRYRGRGLATRLVRAYLSDPLTPATEAMTAMGLWQPFFARAGMTAYPLPRRNSTERLRASLIESHVDPPDLLDARIAGRAAIARAISRWASASKTTRGLRGLMLRQAAVTALLTRPVAYAHVSNAKRWRHAPPPPISPDVIPPPFDPAALRASHGHWPTIRRVAPHCGGLDGADATLRAGDAGRTA